MSRSRACLAYDRARGDILSAMDREHGRGDVVDLATRAAELLARDPRVKLVYLFGSAADPAGPSPRDVDLAVWTDPPFSLEELMKCRADLVLTVGTSIDLVSLNDAPIMLAHEVVEETRSIDVPTVSTRSARHFISSS